MLEERKARILEAVVLDYINTADPVGSRTISKKYDLGVSSATIRNEMADLEEMGYILQPYTSAGRIPSDSGYRYYVNHLMRPHTATLGEERELYQYVLKKQAIDDQGIGDILSHLALETGYMSFMLVPEAIGHRPLLGLLNLQYVSPGRTLMVVLTDNDQVENRMLEIPEGFAQQELNAINGIINHYLKGLSVEHWQPPLLEFIIMQMGMAGTFIVQMLEALNDILTERKQQELFVAGRLNMLDQPEFQDVDKVKRIFKALEHDAHLTNLIRDSMNHRMAIYIGDESRIPGTEECSVIVAGYSAGNRTGHIGFLGPKRMDYARCVSLLEVAVLALEKIFGQTESEHEQKGALSSWNPRITELARIHAKDAWQPRNHTRQRRE